MLPSGIEPGTPTVAGVEDECVNHSAMGASGETEENQREFLDGEHYHTY